jgi:hypothetical protein
MVCLAGGCDTWKVEKRGFEVGRVGGERMRMTLKECPEGWEWSGESGKGGIPSNSMRAIQRCDWRVDLTR